MNNLLELSRMEFKLFLRNFFSVFFAFAFPVSMLLLFGSLYGNEPSAFMQGYGTVDFSMPAYGCMVIAVTALMSLPLTIASYRERKILKRMMASPVQPANLLVSQVAVNFVMTALGVGLLVAVAALAYNLHVFGNLLAILAAFTLTTLSMFAVGLLVAGVLPSARAVNLVAYLLYFPMLFLSGATIPAQMLPEGVRAVSRFLPMTYGVELMQAAWLKNPFPIAEYWLHIGVLGGILVVCTGLAVLLFRWE